MTVPQCYEAMHVTQDNKEEVARWCHGQVYLWGVEVPIAAPFSGSANAVAQGTPMQDEKGGSYPSEGDWVLLDDNASIPTFLVMKHEEVRKRMRRYETVRQFHTWEEET